MTKISVVAGSDKEHPNEVVKEEKPYHTPAKRNKENKNKRNDIDEGV